MNTHPAAFRWEIVLVVGSAILAPASGHAWDGQRKGFQLGLGVGPSYAAVFRPTETFHLPFGGGPMRIGIAPSDQWALLFQLAEQIGLGRDAGLFAIHGSVAACIYFSRTAPSAYAGAGAGLSVTVLWQTAPNYRIYGRGGLGAQAFVGFEFVPHWSVELMGLAAQGGKDSSLLGAVLGIHVLGY